MVDGADVTTSIPEDAALPAPVTEVADYPAVEVDGLARRTASGVAFRMARQVVSMAVSFVAGVLLARTLTPAEYGAMALLTLLVNVASIVTDLGLSPWRRTPPAGG